MVASGAGNGGWGGGEAGGPLGPESVVVPVVAALLAGASAGLVLAGVGRAVGGAAWDEGGAALGGAYLECGHVYLRDVLSPPTGHGTVRAGEWGWSGARVTVPAPLVPCLPRRRRRGLSGVCTAPPPWVTPPDIAKAPHRIASGYGDGA